MSNQHLTQTMKFKVLTNLHRWWIATVDFINSITYGSTAQKSGDNFQTCERVLNLVKYRRKTDIFIYLHIYLLKPKRNWNANWNVAHWQKREHFKIQQKKNESFMEGFNRLTFSSLNNNKKKQQCDQAFGIEFNWTRRTFENASFFFSDR